MAVADYFDTVQKIYIAFYQRPADPAGLRYWAQRAETAGSEAAVINAFANSAEATDLYGPINGDTIGTVIDDIYQALFNRAPDAEGKAFYVQAFTNGELTAGNIALAVLNAAQNDDRIAIDNKLVVANEFTAQVDGRPFTDPSFGTGSTFNVTYNADDVEAARGILAGVTANPATVLSPAAVTDALKEQIADEGDAIENENSGNTFTLTQGVDTIAGTTANDVINALSVNPATGAPGETLNGFDSIDGGAGRDTLNVYVDADINQDQLGTVKNVEVVNIYSTEGVTLSTADASKYQGVEEFWQIGAATAVTNLADGSAAGFRNIDAGTLSVTAAAAAASATVALDNVDDASTLLVAGAALAGVTIAGAVVDAGEDGVEAIDVDINVGKDVQTVTLNTAVAADVTIIGDNADKVTTIDASASTGDIIITGDAGSVTTVTTGSGDDVINLSEALNLNSKIDGGEGNDTVVVGADGQFGAQQYDVLNQLTNIETLAFAQAASVDASELADFKSLEFRADASTVSNLAADQTATVVGAATFTVADAAETVNVIVEAEGEDEATTLTVTAAEGETDGGTLVVSGDADLTFDNSTGRTFATIDLSDLTGDSDVTGDAATVETFILGAGSDTLTVNSTFGAMDIIEGFDSVVGENDEVADNLDGITGFVTNLDVGSAATLNAAFAAAAQVADAEYVAFQFGGNTYVFSDAEEGVAGGYDNADFALQIIGLHDLSDANEAYSLAP